MWSSNNKMLNDFLNYNEVACVIKSVLKSRKQNKLTKNKKDYSGYFEEKETTQKVDEVKKLCSVLKFFLQERIALSANASEDTMNEKNIEYKDSKISFNYLGEVVEYKFDDISKLHQSLYRVVDNPATHTESSKIRAKLFAVLLVQWCESNGLVDYLHLDNTVYDKSLEEVYCRLRNFNSFYNDEAVFLFNSTVEHEVAETIRNEWPADAFEITKKDEVRGDEKGFWVSDLAAGIFAEAKKFPLLDYLLSDEIATVNRREIVEILKRIIKYADKNGNVELKPIVSSMLQWIKDVVYNKFCPQREYTAEDFFDVCGMLAEKATNSKDYFFTLGDEEKYHNIPCVESIIEDILYDKLRAVSWCTQVGKKAYTFAFKQYRLLFLAMYKAKQVNGEEVSLKAVVEKIVLTGDENTIEEQHDMINFEDKFDTIVVFGSAFLMSLDKKNYDIAVDLLCEYASDFSVSNRKKQAASIYILSYLLFENCPMDYALREKVFDVTYGHTMYPLQVNEWDCIKNNSKYYQNRVKAYKDKLTELDTSQNLRYQPLFFFLYHSAEDTSTRKSVQDFDRFLQRAFDVRKRTWFQQDRDNILSEINTLLSFAESNMNSAVNENKIKLAYGLQAVFYAIANIVNDEKTGSETKKSDKQAFVEDLKLAFKKTTFEKMFFKCLYFSDYILRKSNPLYNDGVPKAGLYLLCGCFRVTSAISFRKSSYKMNCEMAEDYKTWLQNEKGRYKILLLRMLSYCSDFEDILKDAELIREIMAITESGTKFLPYDNVTLQAIRQNISNPVEWYGADVLNLR